ncbi:MAG TPA: periplasmic heavy metal sensor [Prolixibacteraceae bacterium]|nr:periplasmic heavy metal sensor [Prolixibacteraceae bacterium]
MNNEQALITNEEGEVIAVPERQTGRFFRDTLNLNHEQQKVFRDYRRQYHRNANQILSDLQQIRSNMTNLLSQPKLNTSGMEKMASRLGQKHAELKTETFTYYYNLRSVLDSNQQMMLEQIFESMLNDKATYPHHGAPRNRGVQRGRMHRNQQKE